MRTASAVMPTTVPRDDGRDGRAAFLFRPFPFGAALAAAALRAAAPALSNSLRMSAKDRSSVCCSCWLGSLTLMAGGFTGNQRLRVQAAIWRRQKSNRRRDEFPPHSNSVLAMLRAPVVEEWRRSGCECRRDSAQPENRMFLKGYIVEFLESDELRLGYV